MAKKTRTLTLVPDKVKRPSGLKKDGTPNLHWKKFENRLRTYSKVPLEDWKETEVLAYILDRYEKEYEINFTLSYSGPPTKCGEMYCTRRMIATLGTEDPTILKEYIDWVYDDVIKVQKLQLESLAFFFTASLCRKFKTVYRQRNKITKDTKLKDEFVSIVTDNGFDAETYGDLAFMKMAVDTDSERDDAEQITMLLDQLKQNGLNIDVLDRLE